MGIIISILSKWRNSLFDSSSPLVCHPPMYYYKLYEIDKYRSEMIGKLLIVPYSSIKGHGDKNVLKHENVPWKEYMVDVIHPSPSGEKLGNSHIMSARLDYLPIIVTDKNYYIKQVDVSNLCDVPIYRKINRQNKHENK